MMKTTNMNFAIMAVLAIITLACGSNTAYVNTNANHANTMVGNAANSMGNGANALPNNMSNTSSDTATSDTEFMKEAAVGNMTEVEIGKMAQSKGTRPDVKQFGQMLETDHSNSQTELKQLSAKKNVDLPTSPDAKHQQTINELQSKSGSDFDKAFIEDMVADHEKDVAKFEDEAKNATNPDVRAWAQKTVPVLRKHLETVKSIQAKMKWGGRFEVCSYRSM